MPKLSVRQAYIERVRAALTMTTGEVRDLPRSEYMDALEELVSELEIMLDAARAEATTEDR